MEELTRGQANNQQWFMYRTQLSYIRYMYVYFNNYCMHLLFSNYCTGHSHRSTSTITVFIEGEKPRVLKHLPSHMVVCMKKMHTNQKWLNIGARGFFMRSCGFIIDKDVPYLGASPDALVECECCGSGVLDIKCPWSAKHAHSLKDAAEELSNFCLQALLDSSLHLSKRPSIIHSANYKCMSQELTTVILSFGIPQLIFRG